MSRAPRRRRDPIELEVFKNLYHSIAEEMGAALRRTAFSPNIKERRDYSCAVFEPPRRVLAMGDHIPVHLGSMPMSVRAALAHLDSAPGDVAMLNDPYARRHAPARHHAGERRCFLAKQARPPAASRFFVASRAHHADVGGAQRRLDGPLRARSTRRACAFRR